MNLSLSASFASSTSAACAISLIPKSRFTTGSIVSGLQIRGNGAQLVQCV
jgi:hypothetical protein